MIRPIQQTTASPTVSLPRRHPRERRRHGPDPQAVPQPHQPQAGRRVRRPAQYLNADATLIRVLFVVLALLGGPGLVIYLLMWILVPEEP
jgi:hypothetical protein